MLHALSITLQVAWKIFSEFAPVVIPLGLLWTLYLFYPTTPKIPKSHRLKAIILPPVNLSEISTLQSKVPSRSPSQSKHLLEAYKKTFNIQIHDENPSFYPVTESTETTPPKNSSK